MKQIAKKVSLSIILTSFMYASGIPVVDAAANAQMLQQNIKEVAEWAKEAKRWSETTLHYKAQLEAYAKDLASQTGIRDAFKFFEELEEIYKNAKDFGVSIDSIDENWNNISELDKKAEALLKKYLKDDPCDEIKDNIDKNLCKTERAGIFKNAVFVEKSRNKMELYSAEFNKIAKDMKKSKGDKEDIKSSLDYANAINLLNAQMQAEKNTIELGMSQLENQKAITEKRNREIGYEVLSGQRTDPNLFDFKYKKN